MTEQISNEEMIRNYLKEGRPIVDIVRELMNRGIKLLHAHQMIDKVAGEFAKKRDVQ